LLKPVEEFGKHLVISGFRETHVKDVEALLKTIYSEEPSAVEIQLFNAHLVATWQHLYFAALNALTAFKNKENVSKSLAMETMRYASAQRQIRKAIELLGIKPQLSHIAVLIIGESQKAVTSALSQISRIFKTKPDDTVLELTSQKMKEIKKAFEVSDAELEVVANGKDVENALVELVIERMALLTTQR
jgi:KEOPS complex subunit Cgi121